jgi:fatty acid desaturase
VSESGPVAMADIRLRGLRVWVSSLIHWPGRQLQGRLDAAEHRLDEIREDVQAELERRARHFEKVAVAWAATALLTAIAGFFLLLGLWLGFERLLGPVAASFLLAFLFVVLAPIPVIVLGKVFPARGL